MSVNTDTQHNLSWEDLFEHATEDTSTYAWAVQEWPEPPEGYTHDYLLVLALSNRRRSRLATALMGSDMPLEYAPYKKQLESVRLRADNALDSLISEYCNKINTIITNEIISHLDDLEANLEKVRNIIHNRNLSEDSEWMNVSLREIALSFLTEFHDLALASEELAEKDFGKNIRTREFQKRFNEIESSFKEYFGYFHIIRDIFPSMKTREYASEQWWLNHVPDPGEIIQDEIPTEIMEVFCRTFQEAGDFKPPECPESDKAIAYALHELDPKENRQFRDHLVCCRSCLDLYLDVQMAEAETSKHKGEIPEVLPKLYKELYKPEPDEPSLSEPVPGGVRLTEPVPSLTEKLEHALAAASSTVRQVVNDFVVRGLESFFMVPKLAAKMGNGEADILPRSKVEFVPTLFHGKGGPFAFFKLDPDQQRIIEKLKNYIDSHRNWKFTAFFFDSERTILKKSEKPEDFFRNKKVRLRVPPETETVFIAFGPDSELNALKEAFDSNVKDTKEHNVYWVIYGPGEKK